MSYLSISYMKLVTGITEFEVGQSIYLSSMQDQNLNGLHIVTDMNEYHLITQHDIIHNQPDYVTATPVYGSVSSSYSIGLDNTACVRDTCRQCGIMFARSPAMTDNIHKCSRCAKLEPKSAPAQKEPFVYLDPDLWQHNDRY